MNILALDTCFGACSVAAGRRGQEFSCEFELRQTGHAEALVPMIERVMALAHLSFSDLDRVAVTTGPGSFTGMRIGIAVARALSLATGVPVAGMPTLDVMAETARHRHALKGDGPAWPEHVLVAVDARKDQVYVQVFGPNQAATPSAQLLSPQDAACLLPEGQVVMVGSGAHLVAAHLNVNRSGVQTLYPDLQPSALCLALMACEAQLCGTRVRPLYLRPPDAKPQDGKSIPRLS